MPKEAIEFGIQDVLIFRIIKLVGTLGRYLERYLGILCILSSHSDQS